MRKTVFQATAADAIALFERAPFVHLAVVDEGCQPILRTLHGLVVDEALVFHGANIGEKLELVGRPVVVTAEEVLARIPSYAIDPERACPATTYYRAAEVRGRLERIDDPNEQAALMAAFMRRFQPEGGYTSIPPGGISLLRVDLRGAVASTSSARTEDPPSSPRSSRSCGDAASPGTSRRSKPCDRSCPIRASSPRRRASP